MAKQINYLVLSYPNFTLGQIIDPDEANQNNSDIVNKVNEFVDEVKESIALGEASDLKSTQALNTANTAKTNSDTALANSNTAINTSNQAFTKASDVETSYTILRPELEKAVSDAKDAVQNINDLLQGTVFDKVGVIRHLGSFIATEDNVNTFTLPVDKYNPLYDELDLYHEGLKLFSPDNYIRNGREITLNFSLNTGQSLHYASFKNVLIDPKLSDGAFLKDGSVTMKKLATDVSDEFNKKFNKVIIDESTSAKYELVVINGEPFLRVVSV